METRFSCSAVLSLSESTLALVPDSSPGISMRIAPVLALRILVFVISSSAKSILLLDKLTISAIVHTYDSPNTTRPYTILVTSNHHGHCSTEYSDTPDRAEHLHKPGKPKDQLPSPRHYTILAPVIAKRPGRVAASGGTLLVRFLLFLFLLLDRPTIFVQNSSLCINGLRLVLCRPLRLITSSISIDTMHSLLST